MADDPGALDEHDLPTQRLPGRTGGQLPSDAVENLAGDLIQPTLPGGSPRSTPPSVPLDTEEATPPRSKGRSAPRPVLGDRYELLEELGRGGMGVVYRAHDRTLGRDVALKVLQVAGRVDAETIGRFQREARAAAALDHSNIVRVHDVGALPDGAPYYTMEMLAGQDLAHAITDANISPKEAVEAVRQVSLALLYAHQMGILHRDLKPQNIFLRRDPARDTRADAPTVQAGSPAAAGEVHALLLDFGLAKLAERDLGAHAEGSQGRKSMQSLTRSGEVFGTPAYMPPEQTHGAKDVDARADIYSLGAALYHALAGRPPFDAGSLAELLVKVQRQDAVPPSVHNREVDADLDTIALKCLQKDPKDRYQTAGDLAEECRRWLAGEPIVARPIGPLGRVWRRAKRNKALAIPLAAAGVVTLAVLTMWGGFTLRDRLKVQAGISRARGMLDRDATRDAVKRLCDDPAGALDDPEVDRLAALIEQATKEALEGVREAQGLASDDRGVRGAVARIYVTQGRAAYAQYLRHRDDVALKEAEELASQISAPADDEAGPDGSGEVPSLEQRREERERGWHRADALREARRLRGVRWSAAIAAFGDALKHVADEPEATHALAELYWDEYRRAEIDRQVSEAQRLEPLVVKYGGREFEDRVRGERKVSVTFLLPPSFAAREVEAYLFEYRPCDNPPVLVPVPFDLASGKPTQDRIPSLTADRSEWEPLSLDALKGGEDVRAPLPEAEVKVLEERATKAIAAKRYADAVPVLDRLTRALPTNAAHPYNLACCFGQGGDRDKALLALEEAIRRGWKDAQATEADGDLKDLRDDVRFQVLLGVLRGEVGARHVRIDSIVSGSPAEKAGLHAGEVLVSIDGKKVETIDEAKAAIQAVAKGTPCAIVIRRGAREEQATADGVPPLDVQFAQGDLTPESATRFPWGGIEQPSAASSPVEKTRWGTVYPLVKQDLSRVRQRPAAHPAGPARPAASWSMTLAKGSYLLWFPPGQGLYETRYPFEVTREYEWNEVCELQPEDAVPPLPPAMDAPDSSAYWRYLPPGPYRASGDRDAQQSPPRPAAVLRVPEGKLVAEVKEPEPGGCWMARFEVTCRMYLEYLNDRDWHNRCNPTCGDWGHVPRKAMDAIEQNAHWPRSGAPTGTGKFTLPQQWRDWPVVAISWSDATDYGKWLTARAPSGPGAGEWTFDLPTEDEWERAARCPDGRFFPWSDRCDPAFCRMQESRPEMDPLSPEPFGLFPIDESVCGVRDLAGDMREWTTTPAGNKSQWRIAKGGTWGGAASICRSADRDATVPEFVSGSLGFRVVARRARP